MATRVASLTTTTMRTLRRSLFDSGGDEYEPPRAASGSQGVASTRSRIDDGSTSASISPICSGARITANTSPRPTNSTAPSSRTGQRSSYASCHVSTV